LSARRIAANLFSALPDRDPSYGGDLLSMGFQVAVVVGGPLFVAAVVGQKLDERFGTAPTLGLVSILVGLAVAGLGMFLIIKRYLALNPAQPTSDAAREAGRRWEREIAERERKKESGEENE
jgi:putative F0F1-ATPase subunit (Ca2+/Mg2+ transporter)